LQAAGLPVGEYPERWNVTHPEAVEAIHRAYYEAGSHVVTTNTFGAYCTKFSDEELDAIIRGAVRVARRAGESFGDGQPRFVALDMGPTGRLLKPYGDLDFEEAVAVFAKTARIGVDAGVDMVLIETMNDSYETKAALLAVKETCDLPVFVSNAYGADGKLMTGASPAAMVALCEGMGADAIGANCSLGPAQLRGVVAELCDRASIPVLLQPNAGLPRVENGKTIYDVEPDAFAAEMAAAVKSGVRIVGGCCGTTPAHICAVTKAIREEMPLPLCDKGYTVVSSYTHTVDLGKAPMLIGERINPTGKKRFKQALVERDMDYILREAIHQEEAGAHILDVNVGLPEIDEAEVLLRAVTEIQAVVTCPLQIDTANAQAMEQALRRYNGKAMVNSVNGREDVMRAVFPLVKKYGGVVVALTLDESGIPDTVEGRMAIVERILSVAAEYGIAKKDIVFDTLAMAVSASPGMAEVTLQCLEKITHEMGCATVLGVSNISFGLPRRDIMNSSFFAMALERGLSAAIMNPYSAEMQHVYYAYRALHGWDENCLDYIGWTERCPTLVTETASKQMTAVSATEPTSEGGDMDELRRAVIKGRREQAVSQMKILLDRVPPMETVERGIMPALDEVGKGFEEKRVYLPQLLMSAEAVGAAFEVLRSCMQATGDTAQAKGPVVLATVEGDIHDIGKNIVKLLLENYGFRVIDLGRDVSPETVVEEALRASAPLVGLSALMTTTVPAMEETIRLLRKKAPSCRVMVGGAVLNQSYADAIGADRYAADAMEGVRYAEEICAEAAGAV
jgi:5-methyltetrahydrofolate--homocysteine methyltransferase